MKYSIAEVHELLTNYSTVQYSYKRPKNLRQIEPVSTSEYCAQLLRMAFDPDCIEYKEFFYCLYLNRANRPIAIVKIAEGGCHGVVVDLPQIISIALSTRASALVLCHNHPSGNLIPSDQDRSITRKVKEAAAFFDMQLLDHIILSADYYYSFADSGTL